MSFEPTATKPLGVLKPPKECNAFGGFSFARGGGPLRHPHGRHPVLCPPGSPFDCAQGRPRLHRGRQRQRWWRGRPRRGLALPWETSEVSLACSFTVSSQPSLPRYARICVRNLGGLNSYRRKSYVSDWLSSVPVAVTGAGGGGGGGEGGDGGLSG
jgi:hypothetical protein